MEKTLIIDSATGKFISPTQIKDNFALPQVPNMITDVKPPVGTKVKVV